MHIVHIVHCAHYALCTLHSVHIVQQFKSWLLHYHCQTSSGSLTQRNWLLLSESPVTWCGKSFNKFEEKSGRYHLSLILRAAEVFFVSAAAVEGRVGPPRGAGSAGAGVERGSSWNLGINYLELVILLNF